MVAPSLQLLCDAAGRLGHLTHGVVADAHAELYLHPNELLHKADPNRVSASLHVAFTAAQIEGQWVIRTRGMAKFGLPDLQLPDIPLGSQDHAARFMQMCAQSVLDGRVLDVGDRIGPKSNQFQVSVSDNQTVLELIPPRGQSSGQMLLAWAEEQAAGLPN